MTVRSRWPSATAIGIIRAIPSRWRRSRARLPTSSGEVRNIEGGRYAKIVHTGPVRRFEDGLRMALGRGFPSSREEPTCLVSRSTQGPARCSRRTSRLPYPARRMNARWQREADRCGRSGFGALVAEFSPPAGGLRAPATVQKLDSFEALRSRNTFAGFPTSGPTTTTGSSITGGDPKKLPFAGYQEASPHSSVWDDVLPRTNNDTYYKGASLMLAQRARRPRSRALRPRSASTPSSSSTTATPTTGTSSSPRADTRCTSARGPKQVEGEAIEAPSAFSIVLARRGARQRVKRRTSPPRKPSTPD